MFLLPDGTFWVQLVNFAIFYAILNVVFLRPVQRAIAKRREYIDSLTSDYDRLQAEASELRAQAQKVHADARREADGMLAEARNAAGNRAAEIAAEASRRAREIVEAAHDQVESEISSARAGEHMITRALAEQILSRVIPEVRA
jgi:F-type H+-transporting ATPase subunit b